MLSPEYDDDWETGPAALSAWKDLDEDDCLPPPRHVLMPAKQSDADEEAELLGDDAIDLDLLEEAAARPRPSSGVDIGRCDESQLRFQPNPWFYAKENARRRALRTPPPAPVVPYQPLAASRAKPSPPKGSLAAGFTKQAQRSILPAPAPAFRRTPPSPIAEPQFSDQLSDHSYIETPATPPTTPPAPVSVACSPLSRPFSTAALARRRHVLPDLEPPPSPKRYRHDSYQLPVSTRSYHITAIYEPPPLSASSTTSVPSIRAGRGALAAKPPKRGRRPARSPSPEPPVGKRSGLYDRSHDPMATDSFVIHDDSDEDAFGDENAPPSHARVGYAVRASTGFN